MSLNVWKIIHIYVSLKIDYFWRDSGIQEILTKVFYKIFCYWAIRHTWVWDVELLYKHTIEMKKEETSSEGKLVWFGISQNTTTESNTKSKWKHVLFDEPKEMEKSFKSKKHWRKFYLLDRVHSWWCTYQKFYLVAHHSRRIGQITCYIILRKTWYHIAVQLRPIGIKAHEHTNISAKLWYQPLSNDIKNPKWNCC